MKAIINNRRIIIILLFLFGVLFFRFQSNSITAGDSGDLVTAAVTGGVAHPPGYPLYTFIGFFLSKIPVFTVAWRVSLLSSIPSLISLGLIYKIVFLITGSSIASVFSLLLLVSNYLFFLYATTPEVFALFIMFILVNLYFIIVWYITENNKYFYWGVFFFGLSLSHHHVMIFFIPSIVFLLWKEKRRLRDISLRRSILALIVGLTPYLYFFTPVWTGSIINWFGSPTISNFIHIISREEYGTFVFNRSVSDINQPRYIQLPVYVRFILHDFSKIGFILFIIGIIFIKIKEKRITVLLFLTLLFFGPIFLMFANFPIDSQFSIGTYERFLLQSYIILIIFIGIGVHWVSTTVNNQAKKYISYYPARVLYYGVLTILFSYCLIILGTTLYVFRGQRIDDTVDRLGIDILNSTDQDSILVLFEDTPLFVTQYIRYAREYRSDVIVLHGSRLNYSPEYRKIIKRKYPKINLPEMKSDNTYLDISQFISQNIADFPIFTNIQFNIPNNYRWMQYGLVYKLETSSWSETKEYIQRSQSLWSTYQNPLNGMLGRYDHLMLTGVGDYYARAMMRFAEELVRNDKYEEPKVLLEKASTYAKDRDLKAQILMELGLTYSALEKCDIARASLEESKIYMDINKPDLHLAYYYIFNNCFHDVSKAEEHMTIYRNMKKQMETPLEF